MSKVVEVGRIKIGGGNPLVFIMGPCMIESRDHALRMAEKLKGLAERLGFPLIYKSSYDKANRTSIRSDRGPGLEKGLKVLEEVKREFEVPVLTDIHEPSHAEPVASVVDVLQIPAFLCRQTDLILAAGRTGKPVNVKKGQFVSPYDVRYIVEKLEFAGNRKILLTERGTCFGYSDLVVDFRSIAVMKKTGYPVVFDATHSVQRRGGETTGGDREFVPVLAKAAVASGCDCLFFEVHDDVASARSDRDSQLPFDLLPGLISELLSLSKAVSGE